MTLDPDPNGKQIQIVAYLGPSREHAKLNYDTLIAWFLGEKPVEISGVPRKILIKKVDADWDVSFKDGYQHLITVWGVLS